MRKTLSTGLFTVEYALGEQLSQGKFTGSLLLPDASGVACCQQQNLQRCMQNMRELNVCIL